MTKEEQMQLQLRRLQMQLLTDEYMSAFLGFAIQKLGNIGEAEELAQEIAYQAVLAIKRGGNIENFEKYLWSIAHNCLKRWYSRRRCSTSSEDDVFSNLMDDAPPVIERMIREEEMGEVRLAVSRLAENYRKTIVCFYYEELSIRETAERLSLTEGMVKFYLRAGKRKLKEILTMSQIGEKSFRPAEFSIYKSGIDFSKVNVWEVFKRKLPGQIAILCHDSAKTAEELSLELGIPTVYLEEEIALLLDAGVMISPSKGRYRTNFHILQEKAAEQIKKQFLAMYEDYAGKVAEVYKHYLPAMKACDIFKFDATPNQWAWYFACNIPEFDRNGPDLCAEDYPQILSCGSRSFVFAEISKGHAFAAGQTPTFLEKCTVHPCDVVAFGEYHCQKELWDKAKAQALYDVYCGKISEEDKALYAELIEQGYVIKQGDRLLCNVAVTNEKSRALFRKIESELLAELGKGSGVLREGVRRVVEATIPEQLRQYAAGFAETWIAFYAGVYLRETLYQRGFLALPEKDDRTPLACWIYEK